MTAATEVVNLGLKDIGYEYINSKLPSAGTPCVSIPCAYPNIVDDCWSVESGRDNVTQQIIPDPTKFPDGIDGLADKVHALGLKIGIYSSAGTKTCAGYPASIGYESIDAATFAAWGIDYLKYDNCNIPANWTDEYTACVPDNGASDGPNGTCPITSTSAPPGYDWSKSNTARRYEIMRNALLAQNRTILFSLCEWGTADVDSWGAEMGNSWRMSGDITPYWSRVAEIMNENSFQLNSVNFWGHNDADMLEVGNGNLTLAETRSHFGFWAAMKSPLIIGTALDQLPSDHVAILANKHLIAFSQDQKYGGPATPYKWGVNPDWTFNYTNPAEYWSGQSTSGTLVMALNSLNVNATRDIKWSEVPELKKGDAYEVTDVWSGQNLGCVEKGVSRELEPHDNIALVVGKKCNPRHWLA
ncbi:hypothetical protein DH86_00001688 [Scytalidium sp. 3C]|nr:hypothetical protein DH86_00001688 [Scytalidium sp. 3C]